MGEDDATREELIIDVLAALPSFFDFARLSFGEIASALARQHRLLDSMTTDPWSDERASQARDAPLLVIHDFAAGTPDFTELFGLMILFQIRRDDARPIIASSRFTPSEVNDLWRASPAGKLIAAKADWRFFKDAIIVTVD